MLSINEEGNVIFQHPGFQMKIVNIHFEKEYTEFKIWKFILNVFVLLFFFRLFMNNSKTFLVFKDTYVKILF